MADSASVDDSASDSEKEELVEICEALLRRKVALQIELARPRVGTFRNLETSSTSMVIDSRLFEEAKLKFTIEFYKLMGIEVRMHSQESIHVKFFVSCNGTEKHVHAIELKGFEGDNCEIGKYFLPPGIHAKDVPKNERTAVEIFHTVRRYCFTYYDRGQQIDDLRDSLESLGLDDCVFATYEKKYVEIVVPFKALKLSPSKLKATFILKYRTGECRPRSVKITCDEGGESALRKEEFAGILTKENLKNAFNNILLAG